MTLEDMNSATSSQELEAGHLPSNLQNGEGRSGPVAVPVSRFRARESGKAMPTNAISGPLFNNSSPSAALQWSLESRLRPRMEESGCPLYVLTWSQWDMPAGPQICRQRASAHRTSGKDFSGWRSPVARSNGGGWNHNPETALKKMQNGNQIGLEDQASLVGWPTPNLPNGGRSLASAELRGNTYYAPNGRKAQFGLEHAAKLTIPLEASDTNASTECDVTTSADLPQDAAAEAVANSPTNAPDNPENVLLTGWATPRSTESGHSTGNPERAQENKSRLEDQVFLTGWSTPTSRDWRSESATEEFNQSRNAHPRGKPLAYQVLGSTSNGYPVPTARHGQLNPEFTRWLMGYPEEWGSCAPTGTR